VVLDQILILSTCYCVKTKFFSLSLHHQNLIHLILTLDVMVAKCFFLLHFWVDLIFLIPADEKSIQKNKEMTAMAAG